MARNTALITDAAQADARQTLDGYAAGIAAHIGGDWSGHLQMGIYSQGYNYPPSAPVNNLSTLSLRLLLTDSSSGDVAVLCPAFAAESVPSSILPIIGLQPQSLAVAAGDSYQLTVYAASSVLPLSYQWYLNGTAILNATSPSLNVPVAVKPTIGSLSYTVGVTNQDGTVLSDAAVVTVT